MKIAIIGGSGMIGSATAAEAASRGHEVTAIARHEENIEAADNVTPTYGDIEDGDGLAGTLAGHDVVISSVRFKDFDMQKLLAVVRKSGVKRYICVGGAGTLLVGGTPLLDTPEFPEAARPEAGAGRVAFEAIQQVDDLDWSFVCPSAMIGPGERTGKFRLGGDELLKDADGKSHISVPDFAIALVDEAEQNAHIKQRFTVGY